MQNLIRLRRVSELTGLSRSSIYEKVAAGTFPAPVKLSARAVAWVEPEVSEWIANRIAERDSGAAA